MTGCMDIGDQKACNGDVGFPKKSDVANISMIIRKYHYLYHQMVSALT